MEASYCNNDTVSPVGNNDPTSYIDLPSRSDSNTILKSQNASNHSNVDTATNEANKQQDNNTMLFSHATLDFSTSTLSLPGLGKFPGKFTTKPTGEVNFTATTPDNHQLVFLVRASSASSNSTAPMLQPTLISIIPPQPAITSNVAPFNTQVNPCPIDLSLNANRRILVQEKRVLTMNPSANPNNFKTQGASPQSMNSSHVPPPLQVINKPQIPNPITRANIIPSQSFYNSNQPNHCTPNPLEIKHGSITLREIPHSQAHTLLNSSNLTPIRMGVHDIAFSRFARDMTKHLGDNSPQINDPNFFDYLNNKWNSLATEQRATYYFNQPNVPHSTMLSISPIPSLVTSVAARQPKKIQNSLNIDGEHSYIKEANVYSTVVPKKSPPIAKNCIRDNCRKKANPTTSRGGNYCSDECVVAHCKSTFKKTFISLT